MCEHSDLSCRHSELQKQQSWPPATHHKWLKPPERENSNNPKEFPGMLSKASVIQAFGLLVVVICDFNAWKLLQIIAFVT